MISNKYKLKDDVLYANNADGNIVVLEMGSESEKCFLIKGLAKNVFSELNGQKTLEKIAEEIHYQHKVGTPESILKKCHSFIDDLKSRNLVEEIS